ncbi:MAG: hypothetical protein ABSA46_17170 [Thermodesulfovibrionales bacterium]|jgi:V/A-type H+-transporting ATPase subunit I
MKILLAIDGSVHSEGAAKFLACLNLRITAIGLTSALLAFVANRLAGSMGNIVVGILVASLLHLMNIALGLFSPTIHSMRLHYVEFFSKFIEYGGRRFEPLRK